MTLEESYEILENYYQNIYGMYDDNWIDYDLDVAFTKLQLEKIIQKRYKLDHQEKMILQWLLEEDMVLWMRSKKTERSKEFLAEEWLEIVLKGQDKGEGRFCRYGVCSFMGRQPLTFWPVKRKPELEKQFMESRIMESRIMESRTMKNRFRGTGRSGQ